MRTRKMRLMSFVLALAMMLAIAPVSAFADEDEKFVQNVTLGTDGLPTGYVNYYNAQKTGTNENAPNPMDWGNTYYTNATDGWEVVAHGTNGAITYSWNIMPGFVYDPVSIPSIPNALTTSVSNNGTIRSGSFSTVMLNAGGLVEGGKFSQITVLNCTPDTRACTIGGKIEGQPIVKNVGGYLNYAVIDNGVFYGEVPSTISKINGGVFAQTYLANTTSTPRKLTAPGCTVSDYIKLTNAKPSALVVGPRKVTVTADATHFSGWKVNGKELSDSALGNPTSVINKSDNTVTLTFTMPDDDVTIDVEREKTPLKIENGQPVDKDGNFWAGSPSDGWEYDQTNKKLSIYDGYTADLRGHDIDWTITNEGTLIGDTFTKGVTNKGTIESGTFAGSFNNSGANAVVKSGVFTNYANFGAQNPSTTWVNVKNGTLNNVITGMARIVGEQKVTVTAKVSPFKGWVYSGDVSDAVAKQIEEQKNNETMTLTLNGDDLDSINLTAKTDGESFGITMLDGKATVDNADVTAAVPGQTVTITMDDSEIPEGMSFDHWAISPDVELEGGFKATDRTTSFTMPAQELTIYASLRTDSDDGTDAMTIVAGVAIGAGAAVLTYHIGTELYAKQVLGDGVAIPRTREEVALKAWKLAGKPAVELNGEPLSETAQAEKWAVESGLMQNVDGSFNGSKKMSKLKALRVLDSAKKMNAQ